MQLISLDIAPDWIRQLITLSIIPKDQTKAPYLNKSIVISVSQGLPRVRAVLDIFQKLSETPTNFPKLVSFFINRLNDTASEWFLAVYTCQTERPAPTSGSLINYVLHKVYQLPEGVIGKSQCYYDTNLMSIFVGKDIPDEIDEELFLSIESTGKLNISTSRQSEVVESVEQETPIENLPVSMDNEPTHNLSPMEMTVELLDSYSLTDLEDISRLIQQRVIIRKAEKAIDRIQSLTMSSASIHDLIMVTQQAEVLTKLIQQPTASESSVTYLTDVINNLIDIIEKH